jgi:flavin-dependent thymidylate synthase
MHVSLIDYTGIGQEDPARHAANVLIFTKNTRLNMTPGLMGEIAKWPQAKIDEELEYMANTIPSSWEFVEYKFLLNGVSRAFTHQLVRTRTGAYAQQTMRVLEMQGWDYLTGPSLVADEDEDGGFGDSARTYYDTMETIAHAYRFMVERGIAIEDARGILPTNILTNIVAKFDLRTMADTARKRASTRTQGEYREVMEAMKAEVIKVHPWATLFFNRTFDKAAAELEAKIITLCKANKIADPVRTGLIKLIDQMRATA